MDLNFLVHSNLTVFQGVLLTFMGFILYWILNVQKARKRVRETGGIFHFREIWWQNNAWNVMISAIASGAVYYASNIAGVLTIGTCLLIGVAATAITDLIRKTL